MELKFGDKGQAAITDAIFFLLVVSSLCVFIYSFSMGYGNGINSQVLRQYRAEFATSALKTIMYGNIPRVENQSLAESSEVDYLSAAVKEDYAIDNQLESTRSILRDHIISIMEPLSSNFDYVFSLYYPGDQNVFLVFIQVHEFQKDQNGRIVSLHDSKRKVYFCSPKNYSAITDKLLLKVGDVSMANSLFWLPYFRPDEKTPSNRKILASFAIWNATMIPQDVIFGEDALHCDKDSAIELPEIT